MDWSIPWAGGCGNKGRGAMRTLNLPRLGRA